MVPVRWEMLAPSCSAMETPETSRSRLHSVSSFCTRETSTIVAAPLPHPLASSRRHFLEQREMGRRRRRVGKGVEGDQETEAATLLVVIIRPLILLITTLIIILYTNLVY